MRKTEPEADKMESREDADTPATADAVAGGADDSAGSSSESLDDLKARAAKANENWERLLRVTADFENFKKRAIRERQDAVKYANEALITRLLSVLDNF